MKNKSSGEGHLLSKLREVPLALFQKYAQDNGVADIDIQVEFVNDNRMNAIATMYKTTALVCVNIGCILNLHNYASLLVMRSDFFPQIGTIEETKDVITLSDYGYPEIVKEETGLFEIYFYAGTDDHSRQVIAALISSFAHAFILFHELAHHVYGHVGFLSNVYSITYLKAHDNDRFEHLNHLTLQCMETHVPMR